MTSGFSTDSLLADSPAFQKSWGDGFVTFTVECKMAPDDAQKFVNALDLMNRLGIVGASRNVVFDVDGDGSWSGRFTVKGGPTPTDDTPDYGQDTFRFSLGG